MKRLRITAILVLLLVGGGLIGCGGGGAKVKTTKTTITPGQQLIDLDQAFKTGTLDEKQFKKAQINQLDKYK